MTAPGRFDLLPADALEQIAQSLAHGAAKHGDRDWEQGIAWSRVFSAAMRHLWAWWNGEDKDQESGLSHLAHAASRLLFLLHYETSRREFDDRRSRKAAA